MMDCLNKFVPTKLTSKRQNLPWLNKSLRKAIRKKTRLYNKAKTSKRPDLWAKYKLQTRGETLDVPVGPLLTTFNISGN